MGNKSELDRESSIVWKHWQFKRWTRFIIEDELHELIENPNKIIYHKCNNVSYQIKLDDTNNRKSILQISGWQNLPCDEGDGDAVEIFINDIDQIFGKKKFVGLMAAILVLTAIVIYIGCAT